MSPHARETSVSWPSLTSGEWSQSVGGPSVSVLREAIRIYCGVGYRYLDYGEPVWKGSVKNVLKGVRT